MLCNLKTVSAIWKVVPFRWQNFLRPTVRSYASEATIDLPDTSFKFYKFEESPPKTVKLTKDDAEKYYTQMNIIRKMENACATLYREKAIRGFCHLYIGQEAVAVGMKAVFSDNDTIITAYRCHGWCYLMGISVYAMIAELASKEGAVMRAKGGSMHMYSKNFFGGNGIVGAQVPLGAGVGLAHKYKQDGGCTFALYGDGAANQGQVFEVYNISCLWNLPVVYVCENNHYAMGTMDKRGACNPNYYERGQYLPGIWVDGMDVLATRAATAMARDYALKNGPIIMEANTYRYQGHSMSDPGVSYRSRDEIQAVREKHDAIKKFQNLCINTELFTEKELKEIDASVTKAIDEIVVKIRAAKEFDSKELVTDVYAKCLEPAIRDHSSYTLKHQNLVTPINIK